MEKHVYHSEGSIRHESVNLIKQRRFLSKNKIFCYFLIPKLTRQVLI